MHHGPMHVMYSAIALAFDAYIYVYDILMLYYRFKRNY